MGVGNSLQHRCVYHCVGNSHAACAPKETFDGWVAEEFQRAMAAQDMAKIRELVCFAPALKDRETTFPGEQYKMTALALALNRRDHRVVSVLLDAGVSPNLPISEQQRSIYAHRSQLAALNGGDPDLQNLTPTTHFEALCCVQHKELFKLVLEKGADPNSGIIQVCHCGDLEMLEALTARGAEPNIWRHESTPLVTSVKSKLHPYEKVSTLLKVAADPNFLGEGGKALIGPASAPRTFYPPLTLATRKRDYRMVRILLEAGADVNSTVGDEGLPNVLFWATYWGELELVKLFVTLSQHRLDLGIRKYTDETIFDVASTSKAFASSRKPRHIAKLPLPSRPAVVYEKIAQLLEDYRIQHPEAAFGNAPVALATGSTRATRLSSEPVSPDRWSSTRQSGEANGASPPAAPAVPPTALATQTRTG